MLLNWAIKKTGSRAEGEDLAQEALCQILTFVKDQTQIDKLDNLIWKIAHYIWCNRLRKNKKDNNVISLSTYHGQYIIDEYDYIDEIAENEAIKDDLAKLRRRIADLSKSQRDIIIAYYLCSKPVDEIAKSFNISVSAVKWRLFDARKNIKERFDMDYNSSIYNPGKLFLAINGDKGPDPDTKRINESLARQNICLLCYGEGGKTIGELNNLTGIPKPYLEYDLEWLTDREFLLPVGKKYLTNFGIKSRRHFIDVKDIYVRNKELYYKKIIVYFHSHENDIREIGFYGCDFKWNKLLWSLLTLYLRYFSESGPLKTLKKYNSSNIGDLDLELHKDGGRYIINGFDQSDIHGVDVGKGGVLTEPVSEPEKWMKVNGVWCNTIGGASNEFDSSVQPELTTYWLGIYIFADHIPSLIKNTGRQKTWKIILKHLIRNDYSIDGFSAEEKELLDIAVKEYIIKKDGGKYYPQFTVFTYKQFVNLYSKIFEPLVQSVLPQTMELIKIFKNLNGRGLPRINCGYIERWTYFDVWDSGIKNFMFAADDGYLYMPENPEDGAALTLSFIC